jgi:hypothetical protein
MSTNNNKDVIYVDAEDEITGIIDKVGNSSGKVVALVLPKRASTFQSIVNMKLLKRQADSAKKHVVLITSEASLMPLAGMSGLHVAPTLQSRPEIPQQASAVGGLPDDADEDLEEDNSSKEDNGQDFDAEKAGNTPVGELAGGAAAGAALENDDEPLEIDNSEPGTEAGDVHSSDLEPDAKTGKTGKAASESAAAKKAKTKSKQDKKFKVPSFGKFRRRLLFAALGIIILVVLYIIAFHVLPSAAITLKTNSTDINASVGMTLDTSADHLDKKKQIVPAQKAQQQKTYSKQVPATGKKNKGDPAEGSVTMSATICSDSFNPNSASDVPAGTGVSSGGLTYITQSSTSFSFDHFKNGCAHFSANDSTDIKAQKPGKQYNTHGTSFSVSGRSHVEASGSADGGSDDIVTIVQQSDIDKAKQQLKSSDTGSYKQKLVKSLKQNNLYAIPATFTSSASKVKSSAKAGDKADNLTVSEDVTYTMYGAQTSALKQLIKSQEKKQLNKQQSILETGLDKASFSVPNAGSGTQLAVTANATGSAGPHLKKDSIKKLAKGKKAGIIRKKLSHKTGVTNVQVHFSPFWVSKVSNPDKISVTFKKASQAGHD